MSPRSNTSVTLTRPRQFEEKLATVKEKIVHASLHPESNGGEVRLVAASKTQSVDTIRQFAELGIDKFGENYLQEAQPKINALSNHEIEWHFIGHVQSNKAKQVASQFTWVQTLDSLNLARRLSQARLASHPSQPLECCIQVNIDNEPQKGGVLAEELPELLDGLADMPGLRIRGLMAIPTPHPNLSDRKIAFRRLRNLFDRSNPPPNSAWDTVSMGMSEDYEDAIGCGANLVRLGTALFGPRD